jgi:DNA replication and repair protein RecF
MFSIQKITLFQFKNYLKKEFFFDQKVVAVCGMNGSGKTNLLDAIYFLCFTKSYFNRQDARIINQGSVGLRLEGNFFKSDAQHEIVAVIRENNRKEFLIDQSEYKKFSEHIGKFPCVMIAPDDVFLITGASDERRRFIDTILSQLNPIYLQYLIDYSKIVQQRNSLLKAINEHQKQDDFLLDTLDDQLIEKGNFIFTERQKFFATFLPIIQSSYQTIAQKTDEIVLLYESQLLHNSFRTLLNQNKQRDIYLQRTGTGIHKDEIVITMNEQPFKSIASQGQRKSLLFALKLAEFKILQQQKGFSPILLLDDVFEKLDAKRMHHLLHTVCVEEDAQVFITDTHAERLSEHLVHLNIPYQLIQLA